MDITHRTECHPEQGRIPVLTGTKERRQMNAQELRAKTPDELKTELANLKKESFNLRFQQATGQLENTAQIRKARRSAALVKTILNEKAKAAE
jgi:ribosomal protein L29